MTPVGVTKRGVAEFIGPRDRRLLDHEPVYWRVLASLRVGWIRLALEKKGE